MNLSTFMRDRYLPYVRAEMEPSTVRGYESLWRRNGFEADVKAFSSVQAQAMVDSWPRTLTRRTLLHLRSFYSGVWSYAIRTGEHAGPNPWREVRVPRARESSETEAYSAEEVEAMLRVLEGPAHLAVAIAAYAGLRKSELQGLRWEDYDGESLHVQRKVWEGREGRPKSRASRGTVPVGAKLREILDAQKGEGWILGGRNLHNMAMRVIVPKVRECGVRWKGWHAFRRGLASRLHEAGVSDNVTQKVLRHERVETTRACYIKVGDGQTREAVETL